MQNISNGIASIINEEFVVLFFFFPGDSSATRQVSCEKHSEDDDMAYFEKCYQERASYYIYSLIQIYSQKRMSKKR